MAGRRPRSLAGTHLFLKDGIYVWRRRDPVTKKPVKRSTGTGNLEVALRKAAEFEEEHDKRKAGLPVFDGWKRDLRELALEWLAHDEREGAASAPVRQAKRTRVLRALEVLGLRTPADLADVARLHDRVMAMEGTKVGRVVATKAYLRHSWQEPLKQFSAWLADKNRYLERDPLACWKPIPKQGWGKRARKSVMPAEVARALVASDWLDTIHGRDYPTRIVWTVLLVSGARAGALVERDARHFDREDGRLDLGADVGNKRRGAATLDSRTADELADYLDRVRPRVLDAQRARARKAGRPEPEGCSALLVGPAGARLTLERMLDRWREAMGLGVVWTLWPKGEPWKVETAHLVNQTLLVGRPSVDKGGNPDLVSDDTRRDRAALERLVLVLAAELRDAWEETMRGVDVHALRKTHRTWALSRRVPEVVIDRQLGHAPRPGRDGMEVLRVAAGSRTGRQHYTDMRSALLDARESAEAVRALLDEALAELEQDGETRVAARA